MSLREKIGQLFILAAVADESRHKDFMVTAPYNITTDYIKHIITTYRPGGIIFLGKGTTKHIVDATNMYQTLSTSPLLIALDAEWGLSMRLQDAVVFPRNTIVGEINDVDLTYQMAQEIGRQLTLIGVHCNLAPVVDVNNNPLNPIIATRSFGDNPELVAQHSIAYMRGLHDAGILSCAKHFPGHGDTTTDSHHDLPVIEHTRSRLDTIELYPFKELIKAGTPAIMTAHLCVPALEPTRIPTSLSHTVVTDVLKNELGFTGLVITDGLGMKGVTQQYAPGDIELQAFLAGSDMLLCPVDMPKAVALIEQAIINDTVSEQELDARVIKILKAKQWAFSQHPASLHPVYDYEQLHTAHAYDLQKKLTLKADAITAGQFQEFTPTQK